MKTSAAVRGVALLTVVVIPLNAAADQSVEQRVAQSRATAQSLMQALKSELQGAMQAGGPVNAVAVCQTRAGGITEGQATADGLRIRRTSLKVRNPANAPDAWEESVLRRLEIRKVAGEDIKTLEYHEVTEVDGNKIFRWMKAIPTAEVCLACHGGDSVAPDVEAELAALYPQDQARGFAVGDIRGAFSVKQAVD